MVEERRSIEPSEISFPCTPILSIFSAMATSKNSKSKHKSNSLLLFLTILSVVIGLVWVFASSSISVFRLSFSSARNGEIKGSISFDRKYLYWGSMIDCPGKHCDSCEGLGHQESSLRCALEEALFLKRVFVMPSRMCINPIHNKKGILHLANKLSQERWASSSCAMDSLYDLNLISKTVPVILDNSETWSHVLSTSKIFGTRGVAHVELVSRADLKHNTPFSNALLINRTASSLSWFMECKDRTNRSLITLPYAFLPKSAAPKLRVAAQKIKDLLGDYDSIHVRRGDKIKTRKDRFGVSRSLHPHLDRDTRPEFIQLRIAKWIPPGRTIFIASNERAPGFFQSLSSRYKVVSSSNFSSLLDPIIENNYQLFMVERLILSGARTFVKTFKEYEGDHSLTDDPKKNTKSWQIPVYTLE